MAVECPQSGSNQVLIGDLQVGGQGVPAVGSPANGEGAGYPSVVAAGPQVVAGRAGVGVTLVHESLVVEGGRPGDQFCEFLTAAAGTTLGPFRVAEGDAGSSGEDLDCPYEIQALHLADELDGVTLGLTSKAVVDPLFLVHRKGRSLLVVKRAQTAPLSPHLLQLCVRGDQPYDVSFVADPTHIVVHDRHARNLSAGPNGVFRLRGDPRSLTLNIEQGLGNS